MSFINNHCPRCKGTSYRVLKKYVILAHVGFWGLDMVKEEDRISLTVTELGEGKSSNETSSC